LRKKANRPYNYFLQLLRAMKFAINRPCSLKGMITSTGQKLVEVFFVFEGLTGPKPYWTDGSLWQSQSGLTGYDRRRAFRFSNEPKGPERDSWKRALEQFADHREVFGNEMDNRR
jgi:hypothetical protein